MAYTIVKLHKLNIAVAQVKSGRLIGVTRSFDFVHFPIPEIFIQIINVIFI